MNTIREIFKDLLVTCHPDKEICDKLKLALQILNEEEAKEKKLFFKIDEDTLLNINDKFSFGWKEDKFGWVKIRNITYEFEEKRMTEFIEWFNSWGVE